MADRISELPNPVLQHILCFLSQNEAVRTSALSKSWRHLWSTRPRIEFRESFFFFGVGSKETFMSVLDSTLQRYRTQSLSVQRFLVQMWSADVGSVSFLEKWVPILVMDMGVEAFHLLITHDSIRSGFALPSLVFRAEFLKELYLEGCRIDSIDVHNIRVKGLQTLSLIRVGIAIETLNNIMASCPLIKRFEIVEGRSNINYFSCFLSIIDFPIALETLKISYFYLKRYQGHNYHFPRLKSLSLSNVQLSVDSVNSFSSNFPSLQELELINCRGFKQVQLLNLLIKRLNIVDDEENRIKTITIDAPHIACFEFLCRTSLPSITFTTSASREWKSLISVSFKLKNSDSDNLAWFLKLNELLKALRLSRISLNLSTTHPILNGHIENADLVGFNEPVVVENLSLKGFSSPESFAALFICFFRIFRPRCIDMGLCSIPQGKQRRKKNRLAEFIICNKSKTNLEEGEFSRCYFWHQDLKELSIEFFDDNSKEWCLVQGPSLTKTQLRQDFRFRFQWGELVRLGLLS